MMAVIMLFTYSLWHLFLSLGLPMLKVVCALQLKMCGEEALWHSKEHTATVCVRKASDRCQT